MTAPPRGWGVTVKVKVKVKGPTLALPSGTQKVEGASEVARGRRGNALGTVPPYP